MPPPHRSPPLQHPSQSHSLSPSLLLPLTTKFAGHLLCCVGCCLSLVLGATFHCPINRKTVLYCPVQSPGVTTAGCPSCYRARSDIRTDARCLHHVYCSISSATVHLISVRLFDYLFDYRYVHFLRNKARNFLNVSV